MDKELQAKHAELREAARPLVEYIRKNYTPMVTAIVTGVGVEVLSTEIHEPFNESWDNGEWYPEDAVNGKLRDWESRPNIEISSQKK